MAGDTFMAAAGVQSAKVGTLGRVKEAESASASDAEVLLAFEFPQGFLQRTAKVVVIDRDSNFTCRERDDFLVSLGFQVNTSRQDPRKHLFVDEALELSRGDGGPPLRIGHVLLAKGVNCRQREILIEFCKT